MTEEIILVRDNHKIPWGFRLTGGRDFNSPLTVVRITGQSIAENRGLKAGDIIIEINNQKTNNLCHSEAQRFIANGGNFLKFIVLRGSSSAIPSAITPIRGMTPVLPVCNFEKNKTMSVISAESVYSLYEDDSFEFLDQNEDEYSEFHEPTEDEINQMLLENAEVLEENGKNVIGVNFKRFIPKCEFIKDSAVFQVLQEEQVHKELSEKEQLQKCPNKRFSTFLAPPDRPIPEPKPKQTDQLEVTSKYDKNQENTDSNDQLMNHESYGNEQICGTKEIAEFSDEENDVEKEPENLTSTDELNSISVGKTGSEQQNSIEKFIVKTPKTEFEVQLNLIKTTLNSLKQLPFLIQSQLSAIQNQIDQLTWTKDNPLSDDEDGEKNRFEHDEKHNPKKKTNGNYENVELDNEYDENNEEVTRIDDDIRNQTVDNTSIELNKVHDKETNYENFEPDNEYDENNKETTEIDDDVQNQTVENTSIDLNKVHDEDQTKRRPACPITPLPRPVVLPGGRIWRKPKDAYNEDFIAETLISQAEVLVGSTVGVNFRKYEPPKFDLSNSAVYKLIHDIETKEGGLQNRDILPSLQDYYQSPISARHFYCANLANRRIPVQEDLNKVNESETSL